MFRRAAALLVASSFACATYKPYESKEQIRVVSEPEGALITMKDDTGERAVGESPLDVEVDVVRTKYEFSAASTWFWTGLSAVATGLLVWLSVDPPEERLETGTVRNDQTIQGFAISGAIVAGLSTLIALPVAIAGSSMDGQDIAVQYAHGVPEFTATLAGHTKATGRPMTVPPEEPVELALRPTDPGGTSAVLGVLSGDALGGVLGALPDRPVAAVFDLEPGPAKLDAETVAQLSEYLSARIASTNRYRVVPRDELRKRLTDKKRESYRECFDAKCQIELGKALAAEKTVSAKLIRVGDQCALTVTVFDLRTEAADAAQTHRTGCEQAGLMDAIDAVSQALQN